ncbi:C-type lectin domain family 2 member D-like [Mauremys reevesii]|uniref:C-type lectin domain family 2 member D-like n=1 Tax=Mauremys reevesii TaxID=260615 RepID=UPI00193F5F9D|nr:C-type lectin domain family 2 member D-like [Mauremys reevesii]
MGPATGAAESEEPLQELRVDGNGHLETVGEPEPPCNNKKNQTGPVVVALIVVSSALIAAIIALAVQASKLSSADLCPACLDGWMGYQGKCYYFSETEGNWTYCQSRCSAPGAALAAIDSEQEMAFLLRHKDIHDHWIGLRREQGQPWKWTNSTIFNHTFRIRGGGDCAYLNDEKGVSSSRCYMERRWICSKLRCM